MADPITATTAYPVLVSDEPPIYRGWTTVAGVPCLFWHALDSIDPGASGFDSVDIATHIRWLASRGYETIIPDRLMEWIEDDVPLPPKPMIVMFDDNLSSIYRVAYPLLSSLGMCGTDGVITGIVYDPGPPPSGWSSRCTWAQIKEMWDSRVIIPLSHGWRANTSWPDYPPGDQWFTDLTAEQIAYEASRSKSDIESNVLGCPCNQVVYPGGRHDSTVHDLFTAAGYVAGYAIYNDTYTFRTTPPYELRRLYMVANLGSSYGTLTYLASKLGIPLSTPTAEPTVGDWVCDNGDDGYAETGTWITGTTGGPIYGGSYRYIGPGSGATATWTVPVPVQGIYDVYMAFPQLPGNSKHAEVDVTHVGGTTSLIVNQQTTDQGNFVKICRCFLDCDTPAEVTVHQVSDGSVMADAVFVRLHREFTARVRNHGGTLMLNWPSVPGVDFDVQEAGPDGVWSSVTTVPGVVGTGETAISGLARRRQFRVAAKPM